MHLWWSLRLASSHLEDLCLHSFSVSSTLHNCSTQKVENTWRFHSSLFFLTLIPLEKHYRPLATRCSMKLQSFGGRDPSNSPSIITSCIAKGHSYHLSESWLLHPLSVGNNPWERKHALKLLLSKTRLPKTIHWFPFSNSLQRRLPLLTSIILSVALVHKHQGRLHAPYQMWRIKAA